MSVHKDVGRIVDVFAASDGGVELVLFKARMEAIEQDALAGNENSRELLAIVSRFVRLTNVVLGKQPDFYRESDEYGK